jgi:hypothetical protein
VPNATYASAYHNYLVEGRLWKSLVVGRPELPSAFFLVAHEVTPGTPIPLLSGRFFDLNGEFILGIERNLLVKNPYGFCYLKTRYGWALMATSMETLLSAELRRFETSHLTVLRGTLHDTSGGPVVMGDDRGLHLLDGLPLSF